MSRVIGYIDGFNLYHGISEKHWGRYLWLDPQALLENLLKGDQQLVTTRYFTARVAGSNPRREASRRRQALYLDAISTLEHVSVHEGQFRSQSMECHGCRRRWDKPEEKGTDVNIAVQMVADVFNRQVDTVMLVSGDSDLVPAIELIRTIDPAVRVVAAFPPARQSHAVAAVAQASFVIGRTALAASQFPATLISAEGHPLARPTEWV